MLAHALPNMRRPARVKQQPLFLPGEKEAAFTLTELLTAIVVLATLIALLLAGTTISRRSAQNAQCVSHLRSISTALLAYAGDHNGQLVNLMARTPDHGMDYWTCVIGPYLGQHNTLDRRFTPARGLHVGRDYLRCPGADEKVVSTYGVNYTFTYRPRVFSFPPYGDSARLTELRPGTMLVGDAANLYINSPKMNTPTYPAAFDRHGRDAMNAAFADGSIQRLTNEQWRAYRD